MATNYWWILIILIIDIYRENGVPEDHKFAEQH